MGRLAFNFLENLYHEDYIFGYFSEEIILLCVNRKKKIFSSILSIFINRKIENSDEITLHEEI